MVKIEVELLLENYKLLSDIAIITGESIDAVLNRLIESCANRKWDKAESEAQDDGRRD